MIQSIDQLELGLRIKTLKEAVLACRARQEQVKQEEADYLDHLAQAEAQVTGKAPGSEGIELTGLVSDNPYTKETPQPSDAEGDAVDPTTGEGGGGPGTGGSGSSPHSPSPTDPASSEPSSPGSVAARLRSQSQSSQPSQSQADQSQSQSERDRQTQPGSQPPPGNR